LQLGREADTTASLDADCSHVFFIGKFKLRSLETATLDLPPSLLLAALPHARATAASAEALRPVRSEAIMASINPEALYNACVSGDAAAVGRLLPAGTPLNLSGPRFQLRSHKRTPLIAAAARGHTDIVRMILERAPNTTVDYATVVGFTALLLSAQYHHVDILRKLADRGANVHLTTRGGNTALCFAVAPICHDDRLRDPDPDGSRQVAVVKALFRLGASTLPLPPPIDPRNSCMILLSPLKFSGHSRAVRLWSF
jgi:hypothetical protein